MSLRDLYQEIIIDHSKLPRNFGRLTEATHSHVGHNPLCGDKLTVYIIEENGQVLDLRFEGSGCAISVASASLMTEAVKHKRIDEITHLFTDFHDLVTLGKTPESDIGKLAVFSGVAEYPMRVKCATLAWHTLQAALLHDPNPASTE